MGFVSSLTTQIVITGVLIGVARRVGLITVNPRVIKSETGRKAFEVRDGRQTTHVPPPSITSHPVQIVNISATPLTTRQQAETTVCLATRHPSLPLAVHRGSTFFIAF